MFFKNLFLFQSRCYNNSVHSGAAQSTPATRADPEHSPNDVTKIREADVRNVVSQICTACKMWSFAYEML